MFPRKDLIMSNYRTLATVAIALAGAFTTAAFAQEVDLREANREVVLSKTRAEVQAELAQAKKDGSIKATSAGYMEPFVSQKSRAQVMAELGIARASGEFARLNSDAPDQSLTQRATAVAGVAR
jgi:Domain of unknown function (DUF4148)